MAHDGGSDHRVRYRHTVGHGFDLCAYLVHRFPSKRIWPPRDFKSKIPTVAWGLTLSVYTAAISLGLSVWKEGAVPSSFLWVSGSAFILVGNLVAWRGAFAIGLKTTSGGKGELVTTGLYRYSRNPK